VPPAAIGANNFVPQTPATQVFTSAQIIGRVGSETILASDVVPLAEEALKRKLGELPKDQRDAMTAEDYEKLKWQFTEALLRQMIDIKIRYADAIATIPKDNLPQIRKNINDKFDQSVLKALLTRYGATTRSELEEKMAAAGQSLDRQRQMFLERSLASGWEEQHVKSDREIPLSEILGYYQQHIAEFEHPAKARWEQLMVSFDRFGSKEEAYRALANMGNEVLRGADFAEVARRASHGSTASKGGAYDWTSKGSLVSKVLDEAIFDLPVGRMSQILEDDKGFHIVRVLERTEAGRTPFLDAQLPIRNKLREEDTKRQRDEFMAKMKSRTPVWTVFDSQTAASGAADKLGGRSTEPLR
jgi:parvulin-like peptidyl-prolyl isomerase